jgi:hypothetical protein
MWIGILLAAACGWLFLCATPRVEGPLQGWRGTVLGLMVLLLAVWQTQAGGLVLPCLSWWQAARRRTAKAAAR